MMYRYRRTNNKNDSLSLLKKVKELAGINMARKDGVLLDNNDNITPDVQDKLARWTEYIQELFEDERQKHYVENDLPSESGPDITTEEVRMACQDNKAPDPDQIKVNIFTLIREEQIGILVDLHNFVYSPGVIPKE